METINVADNLQIMFNGGAWTLVSVLYPDQPLVTARPGVLEYQPAFAAARRLPEDGRLESVDIDEVVVGWAKSDQAWHLGFTLKPAAANLRGGRWCELARWHDAAANRCETQARLAGASLAQTIGSSFRFVAVKMPVAVFDGDHQAHRQGSASPAASEQYVETSDGELEAHSSVVGGKSPVVLLSRQSDQVKFNLPLTIGDWSLKPIEMGLIWQRTNVWGLNTIWGIASRIVLGIIFIFVSVMTLQSPYAPAQPVFLPYLGIIIGVGLILAGLNLTRQTMRSESVVIDKTQRQVRRHSELTNDIVDTYGFDEIRAVVVTQFVQQKQRGRNGEPDRMSHEAWLHLLLTEPRQIPGKERDLKPEDAYVTLGQIGLTEGTVVEDHFKGSKRSRMPQVLYADKATTTAQQIAVEIARAIGVEAYIDQR